MRETVDSGTALHGQVVDINEKWCKGCDVCVAFCPKGVLERSGGGKAKAVHPEKCTRCGLCEIMCPDLAISVAPAREEGKPEVRGGAEDA